MKQDEITMSAKVIECLPSTRFMVQLESGQTLLAYLSGKMRLNKIKIMIEDEVEVAISPYDLTKCRIIWRGKKKKGVK